MTFKKNVILIFNNAILKMLLISVKKKKLEGVTDNFYVLVIML